MQESTGKEKDISNSSFPKIAFHFLLADVFMTQFSALQTARSVRTRRLAAAEENLEVARAARLAQIFKEICDGIISYKGMHVTPHPENPTPKNKQCCGNINLGDGLVLIFVIVR